MSGVRKKKKRDDVKGALARMGRHYRIRDNAVGVSPRLTDGDKLNAKFSQFAYNVNNEDITRAELAQNHPGWDLMYSGTDDSVFIHRGEKKMVFASKGTDVSSIEDLKSDIKLTARPIRSWNTIPRMDESLQRYNYYKKLYKTNLGITDFTATGHSLGGGVALHIARNTGDYATVFNPALPVSRALDNTGIPTSRIIRTNYDVVSRGRTAVVAGERLTVPVSDGIRNPLSAHGLHHFTGDASKTPSLMDKSTAIYDEHMPNAFGAISNAMTTAQLAQDFHNKDLGSFAKHATEATLSTNPIGAAAVTAFEFGSSVVGDIREGNPRKAAKDTIEGVALTTGAFFGVPGLLVGGAIAGATELGYRVSLGHSHPQKPISESMGGAITESGLSMGHLGRGGGYAGSASGIIDSAAVNPGLRG